MGVLSNILSKIFRHGEAKAKTAPAPAAPANPSTSAAPAAPVAAPPPVDVEAVLTVMAKDKPDGGGNWRTSIVDLLKLLDLDSSLAARKELAQELNVNVGDHGSAEQNIALQKAVMQKLQDNGGIVPDSLRT